MRTMSAALCSYAEELRSLDRLEAESSEFHERVRGGFLDLARREPERYLVLDATRPSAELTAEIKERLPDLLPDPVPTVSEDDTGSFPAITDDMLAVPPDRPVTSDRPVASHRRSCCRAVQYRAVRSPTWPGRTRSWPSCARRPAPPPASWPGNGPWRAA